MVANAGREIKKLRMEMKNKNDVIFVTILIMILIIAGLFYGVQQEYTRGQISIKKILRKYVFDKFNLINDSLFLKFFIYFDEDYSKRHEKQR